VFGLIEITNLIPSKRPNRVGLPPRLKTKEDPSFLSIAFPMYLEIPSLEKVHNPSGSGRYTPSSEQKQIKTFRGF
jgi:hypothetical protein